MVWAVMAKATLGGHDGFPCSWQSSAVTRGLAMPWPYWPFDMPGCLPLQITEGHLKCLKNGLCTHLAVSWKWFDIKSCSCMPLLKFVTAILTKFITKWFDLPAPLCWGKSIRSDWAYANERLGVVFLVNHLRPEEEVSTEQNNVRAGLSPPAVLILIKVGIFVNDPPHVCHWINIPHTAEGASGDANCGSVL